MPISIPKFQEVSHCSSTLLFKKKKVDWSQEEKHIYGKSYPIADANVNADFESQRSLPYYTYLFVT